MHVVKRDGRRESVAFDKITARIKKLCYGFDPKLVDPAVITIKVIQGVYDGVSTSALDDLAAETAAYLTTQHPDYSRLAARISVSNLHKMTEKTFSTVMDQLHRARSRSLCSVGAPPYVHGADGRVISRPRTQPLRCQRPRSDMLPSHELVWLAARRVYQPAQWAACAARR